MILVWYVCVCLNKKSKSLDDKLGLSGLRIERHTAKRVKIKIDYYEI